MLKNNAPILLIEDDEDDQNMLRQALEELHLKNSLITLSDGRQALEFLKKTPTNPFIILCDMDMPRMDGMELWNKIQQDPELKRKAIPFIFLTSHDDQEDIRDAYSRQTVQGFFVKGNDPKQIKEILRLILLYWDLCLHPNIKKYKYS